MGGPLFLCSLFSFTVQTVWVACKSSKDRDGDGKRIEIRSRWLDATLNFHSVIEELLWLTLSLTSVGEMKMEVSDYRAGLSDIL